MLRFIIRKLKLLVLTLQAYEMHWLANRAGEVLRLHSSYQLKDLGLNKGSITGAAHHKCPICHPKVWQEWIKDV